MGHITNKDNEVLLSFIDFKKAFDSISHDSIRRTFEVPWSLY
jgi:hypothetical protein